MLQQYSKEGRRIVESYYDLITNNFEDIDIMLEKEENLAGLKEIVIRKKEDIHLRQTTISAIGLIGGHTKKRHIKEDCLGFLINLEKDAANKEIKKAITNAIIHILEHSTEDGKNIKLSKKYQDIVKNSITFKIARMKNLTMQQKDDYEP